MPPPHVWASLTVGLAEADLDRWLDRSKSFRTTTSHPVRCQLCVINQDNHCMQYRIVDCASSTCDAFVGDSCTWRQKIITCEQSSLSNIYQSSQHLTETASPRKPTLTREMKTYAEPLVKMRMKPNKVYQSILDRFGHKEGQSPQLSQVQSFVGTFKRTALKETDLVDDMVDLVKRTRYTPDMPDEEAFTFGYAVTGDGLPIIGEGSDENPTLVGISTPYMIKQLRYAKDFVLHVDTTYKLNQSGYPVFVVGVSDQARSFHPVALFVTSQQTGELIGSALSSVFEQFKQVAMSYPEVLFCMGDADKAQYNAVSTATSTKTGNRKCAVYLMCFFHVVKNVADRVSKLPLEAVSLVFKHLYQMHYARNATEFASEAEIALSAWTTRPDLKTFGPYFKKQWIDSVFWRWACYHTPHGYAKTNNPVEQFNNAIKRDYSLRTLLKLVALTDQLTLMCCHRSRGTTTFALGPKPNRELQDRDKYLARNGRLSVIQPHKHGLDFLLDEPSETHIAYVYQRGAPPRQPEVDASKEKKKMGKRNKHRMEIWQQPADGWRVDMQSNVCPCHSWYKYRLCVHLLAALKATGRAIPGVTPAKVRFVNRRRKRKGRNADVGPALALE